MPRLINRLLTACLALAFTAQQSPAAESVDLIAPASTATDHAPASPRISRTGLVTLDLDLLNHLRATTNTADQAANRAPLRLRLFNNISLTITIDHIESQSDTDYTIHGSIHEGSFGTFTAVMRPDAFSAAIHAPAIGTFDVTGHPGQPLLVRQHDDSADAKQFCGNETIAPVSTRGVVTCPHYTSVLAGYPSDDGSLIDVMVYYTQDALTAVGSVSQLSANIDLAITITNDTMQRSAISPRVRCIRKAQIAYTESGVGITDLNRLVNPSDGFLDTVHAERDTYGADLVELWVNNLDAGGVGYSLVALGTLDDGRNCFTVCRQDNFAGGTTAHELGHNFGCQHDRPNATSGPGFFYYSYGFRDPISSAWHTVMAYPPGTMILYYSNPNVNYPGPLPNPGSTGVGGTDPSTACNNALTVANTAWTVANFRPSALASPPASRMYVRPAAPLNGDGSSWATAKRDLQDAIATAVQSRGVVTEIWTAAGTYYPNRAVTDPAYVRTISFRLVNGVTIYGGFAGTETLLSQRNIATNLTTLSGDIGTLGSNSDNSYHVVDGADLSPTAVLDGFTITKGYCPDAYPNDSGAGFHSICGNATIRNCSFTNNTGAYGPAAGITDGGAPQLINCTFDHNTATANGGAVHCYTANPTFTGCTFDTNSAANYGAVNVDGGAAPTFTSCNFINNSAPWGGAFGTYGCSPTLNQCTFTTNSATSNNGGGFMAGGASAPVLIQCNFNNNAAIGNGGGIYCFDLANAQITNCTFTGNTGDVAGGIFLYNAGPTITGCTFTSNIVGCCGGGIAAYNNSNPNIRNCTFLTNNANYGAGVWFAYTSPAIVTNSLFLGNVAQFGGGAVHVTQPSAPVFTNCVFSGNRAPQNVGGVALNLDSASPSFINCTASNNSAQFGAGGIWNDNCTATLTNSIFWQNTDPSGSTETSQITKVNGATATVNYCIIHGLTGALGGTGNIGTNPLLIDADGPDNIGGNIDDNLRISSTSPAIDSGNNNAVPVGITTDAAANPRFVNVPCVTDTGVGTAPIVDRGAYEFQPLAPVLGDLDGNSLVNLADIPGFVSVMLGTDIAAAHVAASDMNCDSLANGRDISPFVKKIIGP